MQYTYGYNPRTSWLSKPIDLRFINIYRRYEKYASDEPLSEPSLVYQLNQIQI